MNNIQWIGAHDDSYNLPKKSRWFDYYKAFTYRGIKYKVGDFVLIKGKELRVAKLISVFHSLEKNHISEQHRGIVQWYLWAQDVKERLNGNYLKLNDDHEVIETNELTTESISLKEIERKCQIIFASIDDPIFKVQRNKFKFDIYCCRYKLDCDFIVPIYPNKSFDGEDTLSESDIFSPKNLSSPSNSPLKRKPDCSTPKAIDCEDSDTSLVIPLKNLKLTPKDKLNERKELNNSRNSVKRVLVDSFDESSGVSYTIVNTRYTDESIKVTLKLDNNVKVHPTYLTDEVVTMRSPIKLRHIQRINNRIELSEDGKIELNGDSNGNFTPTRTPAKITVRRSTRTTEKPSYKGFYSSEDSKTERQKRVIRTPRRYEDGENEINSSRSAKGGYTTRGVSSKVASAKKTITFDDATDSKPENQLSTRRSQRTIRRSIRYIENSDSEFEKSIYTPKKKLNFIDDDDGIAISDDDEEVHKPRKSVRNSRLTLLKTPSKNEESLKTPKTPRTPKTKDTPSARAKLVREGVITPAVQCRQKAIIKDNTPLSKARNQLHVSYVPQGLPCREQEYLGIANFLKGKLLDGCGGCMYVSGVPGTGKTATVTDVVNSLQDLIRTGKIPSFKYVNVNGMRLSEPRQAYVEITKQLLGKTLRWEQAQTTLENMFVKNKKKSSPIIMVIDELDILCTKRQDVVYNLLDWPTKANSQLIVITIANTMDLPERLLMGRVTSRLGLTRLTFQPYTHKQLQEIVTKRLMGTDAFNPDAIQLVARKVASVSGDARRALDICRRAAEIAELEGTYTLVALNHVNEALNSMITQPKVQAIKQCSRLEKLILQAVVAEVERTGVEETNFTNVFSMLLTIAAVEGFEMVSRTTVMAMVARLGASRLLLTDQKCNDIHQRIILNASIDDIYYALMKTDV